MTQLLRTNFPFFSKYAQKIKKEIPLPGSEFFPGTGYNIGQYYSEDTMKDGMPVVVIVGRPNTGKSSLFNLLLGERKSIVDEMEGVTRDINMGKVTTSRLTFWVYDTAGYLEKGDRFNTLVQEKVMQALTDADMILFVVDGRSYHPVDEELGRLLRRQSRPVVVLCNKLDNAHMEELVHEFYGLGFDEVEPFSVIQKRGLTTIIERIEDEFEEWEVDEEQAGEIRIALVGKPNVGKSHLLNTLLGYNRSIVSEVAGTTRDSLDEVLKWQGHQVRLVDTAGIRRQGKIDEDIEYYSVVRSVQAMERSDVVIQLLDASEPITNQDKRISQMVQEKGRALIFAVNKWDLVDREDESDNYTLQNNFSKKILHELPEYNFVPINFISAKDGYKVDRLMDRAFKVYQDFHYRVSTADLNQWLIDQVKESHLDRPTSNLKVYYCTQVHTAPPRFVFFINKKEHVRKDFARHLENRLRLAFEFSGVPIHISFREKNADRPKKKK